MNKIRKLTGLALRNEKGSALITVFLVLIVLIALGMGVMALSVGSAKQAAVTDTYEKAYYVAEGGTQQGIEYIRNSIADIYKDIKADVITFSTKDTSKNLNSDYFFTQLNQKAASFAPADPDASPEAAVTGLTVTIADSTGSGDTRDFTVTASAMKGAEVKRVVKAHISVHFVRIDLKSVTFRDEALITLGTFTQKSTANGMVITGDTLAAGYDLQNNTITGTKKLLSDFPDANTDALDWHIDYDKRLAVSDVIKSVSSKKTTGFAAVVVPDSTKKGSDQLTDSAFGGKKPTLFPLRITEAPSANPYEIKVWNGILENISGETQIDCSTDLTIGSPVSGTASNRVKIYCSGNLTINYSINYVDIYCAGTCTVTQKVSNSRIHSVGEFVVNGGEGLESTEVFCDSSMDISKRLQDTQLNCKGDISLSGSGLFGTNKIYSGGSISMGASTTGTIVLYAEKTFSTFGSLSFNAKGIIYTNGSINPGALDFTFEGQIAAKGPLVFQNGTYNLKANPDLLSSLEADSFVTAGTTQSIVMPSILAVMPPANTTITEP